MLFPTFPPLREGKRPLHSACRGRFLGETRSSLEDNRGELILKDFDFALERPLIGLGSESGFHWILADIVPFFRVAFTVAQNMIEESGLPMGRIGLDGCGQGALEQPNGGADFLIVCDPDEAVHMVGHDDIASKSDAVLRRLRCKLLKFFMNGFMRKQWFSAQGVEGYEVDR